jgi:hypothetical protein
MTIQNKFWKHLLRNNTTQNNNQFAELVDANCELLHLFGWTYQQMTWRMTLTICAPVLRSSATPLWLINLINVQNMQTLGQIQPTIKTSRVQMTLQWPLALLLWDFWCYTPLAQACVTPFVLNKNWDITFFLHPTAMTPHDNLQEPW